MATPATSILVRHDVDERLYLEAAAPVRGLVHLDLPDGEGALVGESWVLTAAHVAVEIDQGHQVTVVDRGTYRIAEVFIHPDWDDGPHDIALLRLSEDVEDAPILVPYEGRDEYGKIVVVAGRGDHGTGRTGPVGNDGRTRAATNRVDRISEHWLRWQFDDPNGDGRVTPLEGISGPGDSGGPALWTRGATTYVLGVSSGQSTRATGGREGLYGVTEFYTRVSSHTDWIAETLARDDPPEP